MFHVPQRIPVLTSLHLAGFTLAVRDFRLISNMPNHVLFHCLGAKEKHKATQCVIIIIIMHYIRLHLKLTSSEFSWNKEL